MRLYIGGALIGALIAVSIMHTAAITKLSEKVQYLENLHNAKD